MNVLTLCGSLRAGSSNRSLLRAYERLASGMRFIHYQGIGGLPHFNPDLAREGIPLPEEVAALRASVTRADALVISTPEYARCLPGSFKNALDWLVGEPGFAGKPVAILHLGHSSMRVPDLLREVLETMSARVIDDASVTLPAGSNHLHEDGFHARDEWRSLLLQSSIALKDAIHNFQRPVPG